MKQAKLLYNVLESAENAFDCMGDAADAMHTFERALSQVAGKNSYEFTNDDIKMLNECVYKYGRIQELYEMCGENLEYIRKFFGYIKDELN